MALDRTNNAIATTDAAFKTSKNIQRTTGYDCSSGTPQLDTGGDVAEQTSFDPQNARLGTAIKQLLYMNRACGNKMGHG